MDDRHGAFLEYYDRERVQPGLVFFRHRAAALARRRRRHLDAAAGLLALVALGALAAFALGWLESNSPVLWLAVMGPVLVMAVATAGLIKACDSELERCRVAYLDLERMRAESFPHPTRAVPTLADLESYVDSVESFLAVAPYRHTGGEEARP